MSSDIANGTSGADQVIGPELIIGLVTPVGTNTSDVSDALRGALSQCGYRSHVIKVTDFFNKHTPGPAGENEDERVRRLIKAGDDWCKQHGKAAAVVGIAVNDIRSIRAQYHGEGVADADGQPIPRTAYVIHSLKRSEEVTRLREIYGPQFLLLGCQAPYEQRIENLLKRPLSASTLEARRESALELMRLDASEDDDMGQKVSDLFPQSDFFLRSDESPQRFTNLVFGDPKEPANMGEVAMSLAVTASLQSLSTSRRVGASLLKDESIIAVGCNEVPRDETPDIQTGKDASEQFKLELLRDTLQLLHDGELLNGSKVILTEDKQVTDEFVKDVAGHLKKSQLMSVIEYQRPVHAEAKAINDAARRGQAVEGADLYCNTYPCHLCFKAALDVKLRNVYYIDPYPKSRAELLFPTSAHKLVPYEGVAPRMYPRVFERSRYGADQTGEYLPFDAATASPIPENLVSSVRDPEDIAQDELVAIANLQWPQ